MNISEMHVYFRQYAQQMGMQNVRAILPEQIDVLLNTAISDKVNKIIRENVSVTGDRIISDNAKVSHINALKPLYKVDYKALEDLDDYEIKDSNLGIISFTYDYNNDDNPYLYVIGFAINYKNGSDDTRYFPVRLVDDSKLADTLNDFVLRNRCTSPIITIINDTEHELYIEKFNEEGGHYKVRAGLEPYKLRISYIEKPAKVFFDTAYNPTDPQSVDNSQDCNLPEFLHIDIVKAAVDLYRIAVNGGASTYTPQDNTPQTNEQPY